MKNLFSFVVALLSVTIAFVVQANVQTNINITEPAHHLAKVTITFEPISTKTADFKLPTWRTGRYEILKLANGVREFSVVDKQGKKINWHKTDKNTWRVTDVKNKTLTISYQVYANQLGKRTRHIDDSHAFIDASAMVMYTDAQRQSPYIINLVVPSQWRSVSGLTQGTNNHQFITENYDVLVDSPIETGIHISKKFSVDGRDYEVVIWGDGNYNVEQITNDLKTLVKQPSKIWDDYPFSRYVFMIHATSGARGATEHINSTIIQRSRYAFNARKDYLGFLSTAAHEFVHTWNVKAYRPEGLYPYDYQKENYTSLLWLAEGSTSYLQSQLLMRGKLMTSKEYLKELAKRITGFLHKPGRNSQSVAEASFDNWISEGGDYGQNNSVNIYSEGFLVSWLLDFNLLATTDLEKSYRDVHKALYNQYKLPHAYTENDVQTILKQLTGKNYHRWWQQNVHGHPQVNFKALLAKAGLKMFYGNKEKTNVKTKAWAGLKTKKATKGIVVTHVEKNSPAWQAELAVNDIIVAVDGLRLNESDINKRFANFKANTTVQITFFRRDKLMTTSITLAKAPKEKLKIVPIEDASRQQKAFFKAWTGLDFPKQ